ncbi:MAG: hypothetical protein ACRDJE_15960 [Dehalococcoidia bacterium]
MSVELSHRLARAKYYAPIVDLRWPERRALWLACERADDFTGLSEQDQQFLLEAEAARERAIAEQRAAVGR